MHLFCSFLENAKNNLVYKILHNPSVVTVWQSRKRPGVAKRVPGGLDSQIFMTVGTKCGEVVTLTHSSSVVVHEMEDSVA